MPHLANSPLDLIVSNFGICAVQDFILIRLKLFFSHFHTPVVYYAYGEHRRRNRGVWGGSGPPTFSQRLC